MAVAISGLRHRSIRDRARAISALLRRNIPESGPVIFVIGAVQHSESGCDEMGFLRDRLCRGRWCWRAKSPTLESRGARLQSGQSSAARRWRDTTGGRLVIGLRPSRPRPNLHGPLCPCRVQGWHSWRTRCSCNVQVRPPPSATGPPDTPTASALTLRQPHPEPPAVSIRLKTLRLRKKQAEGDILAVVQLVRGLCYADWRD
jgi:hypothetical protein